MPEISRTRFRIVGHKGVPSVLSRIGDKFVHFTEPVAPLRKWEPDAPEIVRTAIQGVLPNGTIVEYVIGYEVVDGRALA